MPMFCTKLCPLKMRFFVLFCTSSYFRCSFAFVLGNKIIVLYLGVLFNSFRTDQFCVLHNRDPPQASVPNCQPTTKYQARRSFLGLVFLSVPMVAFFLLLYQDVRIHLNSSTGLLELKVVSHYSFV